MTDVYVASKSQYGTQWQDYRKRWAKEGIKIISTWIDESGEGETENYNDLWSRCIDEAYGCNFLVAYHAGDEVWKGAFIEIGVALAAGNIVIVVGNPPGTWTHHHLVRFSPSLAAVPEIIRAELKAGYGRTD